jgi:hypothetical protein
MKRRREVFGLTLMRRKMIKWTFDGVLLEGSYVIKLFTSTL